MPNSSNSPECLHFYRGRTALYAILRALNLQEGDEVILQAYTCLAVALPILVSKATPVYADVDRRTYTLDPFALESRITPRARVLIIQHTFGIPAELDALMEIAKRHRLNVIEDCCHVYGSTYGGRPLGSFGAAAFYSNQWSKPVVLGRGGSAVINDSGLEERVKKLHSSFAEPGLFDTAAINLQYLLYSLIRRRKLLHQLRSLSRFWSPEGIASGTFKREELQYGITADYTKTMAKSFRRRLNYKLRSSQRSINDRRRIGDRLHKHLVRLGVSPVKLPDAAGACFMRYPLLSYDRQEVLREGLARNIDVSPAFRSPVDPLLPDQWARIGYKAGSCPVAEDLANRTVTLPVHDWPGDDEVDQVLRFADEMTAKGHLDLVKPRESGRVVRQASESTNEASTRAVRL
ncbi:MAG: DegT/DnrJ/EryC1/StrS family aminotransferase [Candidatus Binataceae bacterium]